MTVNETTKLGVILCDCRVANVIPILKWKERDLGNYTVNRQVCRTNFEVKNN